MSYTWNPLHPCGTCFLCGGEMVHNVPRLGPSGGYVHKATGYPLCGPRPEIEWSYRNHIPTDQEIISRALNHKPKPIYSVTFVHDAEGRTLEKIVNIPIANS